MLKGKKKKKKEEEKKREKRKRKMSKSINPLAVSMLSNARKAGEY